jgi:hypothetical protein
MRIRWSALVPLLALVLGTASTARAEYLNWSYSWSMTPPTITSAQSGIVAATVSGWTTPGVTSPVDVVTLTTFASSSSTNPGDFVIPHTHYDLTLSLTDNAIPGMLPKTITMGGEMWGTVSPTQISVFNSFTTPTGSTSFGGHSYSVTLTKFTPPTLDGLGTPVSGAITAQISVDKGANGGPGTGGGGPSKTPEPASLVLAGMVFPVLMWYRGRRRPEQEPARLAA